MIPFKFIMLGMPLEDSMGLDVSEKTIYRNQYGIDALIDLSVKLVGIFYFFSFSFLLV